jgi:type II secretory pathway pseudopilin PulG
MKRAFSLIELLIYMGLVSVFLVIITNMFITVLQAGSGAQALASVDQDAEFILDRLAYDIHRASQIITPADIGETGSILSLKIDNNIYTYTYDSVEKKLKLGSFNLNSYTTLISDFSITRIGYVGGTPSAQINLGLQSVVVNANQTPEIRQLQTTYFLR